MAKRARAWIDGAARGNPGAAGFGVHFESDGEVEELAGFLGRTTNNVAEYAALLAALALAQRRGVDDLKIYSDSLLMVSQITGVYKVRAAHLRPYFFQALALRRAIREFAIQHVRREDNRDADRLANRAIDERVPPPGWLELPRP